MSSGKLFSFYKIQCVSSALRANAIPTQFASFLNATAKFDQLLRPDASEWFAQGLFRHHFYDALHVTKFRFAG